MLLQSEHDLVALLGVAAFILLALAVIGGVIASLKSFQVRQFQDLLFKAERKIDTLERRMFNVLNAVPVALVETDTSGKFTFANRSAHQLLGRKDSELLGLRFHSATWGITYPDGRMIPADLLPIARTLRGQTVKGFQHLLVNHGSREKVLVSVTSMPIMNGAGEIIGSTAAMVELETASGEGIDDLNGLWRGQWFAAATVPFWGLDSKGQIIDINNAALDAFDLTREQALGQNWTQFFVADGDFQKAIDYLGDRQDDASPHNQTSIQLTLKASHGDSQPCVVTAWVVRTHEGGDSGLTVTALPSGILPAAAPSAAPADEAHALAAEELADHRLAEEARAALGVGTWQYDAEADTIVEDAGMMALIGREYPGGPTLISDTDQAVADTAFGQLMSGESDHLALDIKVTRPDGSERWIALEGQAKSVNGERHIYGVAFDCTTWKSAQPAPALEDTVSKAREAALAEARTAFEAELEAARIEAALERESAITEAAAVAREEALSEMPTPYDWHMPPPLPDPVIIHEPDPLVMAENAELRARITDAESRRDALQRQLDEALATKSAEEGRVNEMTAELGMARAVQAALETELNALHNTPVVEPDYSAYEARIRSLQTELKTAEDEKAGIEQRYRELAETPAPEPDFSAHESRIAALEDSLKAAQQRHDDLAQRYHVLSNTPAPEPDYRMHEARITGLKNALDQAAARHAELQAAHKALLNRPAPEPDTSEWEAKLAAAQFDITKWQAAYHDAQARLEQAPAVDHSALEARLNDLQTQFDRANEALSHAQRYETVGRLTSDVAQDFAQMLNVINGALEVMARQSDSPENIRRLSEAALAAGKRGERLTRQLQAFQSEEF
ncbi:PAS domain S-box protein [Asticcacaulis sp.]|uniref:PAS domain S-box protein n=1 Tax=Asticcacaulis sp. TaxID=1872648 RepID=UPI002C0123C8|nr:PAS domain S-box protein [Asticcacaulis sp.]HTM80817.1 PAS domain S-box protein [Asticcacaulis sp.]